MTDIQAALGLHQLRKLPQFHLRRREIAGRYQRAFAGRNELQTPVEKEWAGHAWHLYPLRLNLERTPCTRDQFISELHRRNIGTSVHFIPVHLHPYYRDKYGYSPQDFPVAYANYQRLVSLPCSPRMLDQDVDDVIEAVREVLQGVEDGNSREGALRAACS
jgi:dTDP-4-amino-4,6-dideoxygalactose transaminase